jgi:hypothetical protein
VLAMLGVILLIMARKYMVSPLEEEEKGSKGQSTTSTDGT